MESKNTNKAVRTVTMSEDSRHVCQLVWKYPQSGERNKVECYMRITDKGKRAARLERLPVKLPRVRETLQGVVYVELSTRGISLTNFSVGYNGHVNAYLVASAFTVVGNDKRFHPSNFHNAAQHVEDQIKRVYTTNKEAK